MDSGGGRWRAGIVLGVLVWLWSCAGPPVKTTAPLLDPQAGAAWRAQLDAINPNLDTLKLIGRLDLVGSRGRLAARVAWAMAPPDRLRIDLLGGLLPSASLASSGRQLYWRENDTGRVRSRMTANPSLEPILGLAVTVKDVVQIMAGRLPELSYDAIRAQDLGTGDETLLTFEKRWGGSARVIVSSNGAELRRVEMLAPDGTLRWRVDYRDYQAKHPYRLPATVEIADETRICTLRVEKMWTDVALDDRIFVLSGPDGDR